ncbi:MAG: type IX secretion system membrane protein PorP/SprF [Tannerella sp.]|jgi:type IX secretion system PorP/SprF family membrane protein|nr:type IX secretion system membrane protein PorP/SprF [Tannerella sp.]
MERIVLIAVIVFGSVAEALSQRDAQFTHYRRAMGYYNPAVAGLNNYLNVAAGYRLQWLGWSNAPKTLFAMADMPFKLQKRTHGLGVAVTKDTESSVYSTLSGGLQYAFLQKIGKGELRIGVQLGLISLTVDGTKIILPVDSIGGEGASDPAIPTAANDAKKFDAHLGIYYSTDKWYVGAAAKHLFRPEIDDDNLYTYFEREYNFLFGYNIQTNNPLLQLQPSVFVKTNFNTYTIDLTTCAVYGKKYSAGMSWRTNESASILLGATFGKIDGGYAYDFPLTAIRKGTSGSHELFLKYKLQLNKPKTKKSKHKSVRLL